MVRKRRDRGVHAARVVSPNQVKPPATRSCARLSERDRRRRGRLAAAPLGTFETDAANEPGHRRGRRRFRARARSLRGDHIGAEIAEARWIARTRTTINLAPLSRDILLALIWG